MFQCSNVSIEDVSCLGRRHPGGREGGKVRERGGGREGGMEGGREGEREGGRVREREGRGKGREREMEGRREGEREREGGKGGRRKKCLAFLSADEVDLAGAVFV